MNPQVPQAEDFPGRQIISGVVLAITFVMLALLLIRHYNLIHYPYQHEYREGAPPLFTTLLLSDQPVYSLASHPAYTNVYGIGYPLVVYPFAKIFGPTLPVHRAVSGLCILLSTALVLAVARRQSASWAWASLVATAYYASHLGRVLPLARADALGEFLFLLTLFVPWWFRYSTKSLTIAALLGVTAFFTKPYFVLGLAILSAYIFLFVSKSRAVRFALSAGVLLVTGVAAAAATWEMYLFDTFVIHQEERSYVPIYMVKQLAVFFWHYGHWLVIGLGAGAIGLVAIVRKGNFRPLPASTAGLKFNLKEPDFPLSSKQMSLPLFALIVGTSVIIYPMGGHVGNWLTYPLQLMAAPLLLVGVGWANGPLPALSPPYRTGWSVLAVALAFAHIVHMTWFWMPAPSTVGDVNWTATVQIQAMIASAKHPYVDATFVSMAMAAEKPVYDSGQSVYFEKTADKLIPHTGNAFTQNVVARAAAHRNMLRDNIQRQTFDLILVHEFPVDQAFVLRYYRIVSEAIFPMPQASQRWTVYLLTPIPGAAPSASPTDLQ